MRDVAFRLAVDLARMIRRKEIGSIELASYPGAGRRRTGGRRKI